MDKRFLFINTVFLFIYLTGFAQKIDVKSFQTLPNDQTARIHNPVKDQNGEKCALIKVVTTQEGFVWEGGTLGITKVEKKTAEYWVYVPRGSKKITIKHDQLGVLRGYQYPQAIKEATTYEMVLTIGNVKTIVEEPDISTAWLMISSDPEGADAYVDEKYLGTTPLQIKMKTGKYNYRISKDLFAPEAGVVTLSEDEARKKLEIALNPNHGGLFVNSSPEQGAKVYIDGKETNKVTPCSLEKLSVGEHTVTLRKRWYEPNSEKFVIEAGQKVNKQLEMEKSFGVVAIKTNPSAQIYQDGENIGTGRVNKRLMPGVYNFKAEKDKYHSDEETIEIHKGDDRQILLTLQPRYGTMEITTEPWEASVQLNGKKMGVTPITIDELLVGKYNLKIEKEGYKTITKTIEIKEDEETVMNEKLISGKDIRIESTPEGGRVKIDGEDQGTTPVYTKISYGEHEVEIEKGEYIAKDRIKVKQDDVSDYTFNLSLKKHFYISYTGSVFLKNTEFIAPIGIRIGQTGGTGWYLSGRISRSYLEPAAYEMEGEYIQQYPSDKYYEIKDVVKPVFSVTGGFSTYLGANIHLYLGAGYGKRMVYRQISEFSYSDDQKLNDAFVNDKNYLTEGFEFEGGLMLRTNVFIINLGISTLNTTYTSIVLGAGLNF